MDSKNVVYSTGFGCSNLSFTARYTIENLVVTKNCVNTHILTAHPSRVNLFNSNESAKWCKDYFARFVVYICTFSSG